MQLELDVICIVRGGGAKTDLIYFDSEKIARAIANSRVPVITGIGHEIDKSIADMVAHDDKITPTDCAKFLESRVQDSYSNLSRYLSTAWEYWKERLQIEINETANKASSLKYYWDRRQSEEWKEITRMGVGLERGPWKLLDRHKQKFEHKIQLTRTLWKHAYQQEKNTLELNLRGLKRGPLKLLQPELTRTRAYRTLISSNWNQGYKQGLSSLSLKLKLVHNLDPVRQLEKGYSLIRNRQGESIRRMSDVSIGEELKTEIADGFIDSKVTSTKEKK
jgi:exodeoxyribonuclease VII large subunit